MTADNTLYALRRVENWGTARYGLFLPDSGKGMRTISEVGLHDGASLLGIKVADIYLAGLQKKHEWLVDVSFRLPDEFPEATIRESTLIRFFEFNKEEQIDFNKALTDRLS